MGPLISPKFFLLVFGFGFLGAHSAAAQTARRTLAPPLTLDVKVGREEKISNAAPYFTDTLDEEDTFGNSAASLGDLDGDGVADLAVGVYGDSDAQDPLLLTGLGRGAVWVLFPNADGTIRAKQKINDIEGGFEGTLDDNDRFGSSVAALGDLDEDGYEDLAVGAHGDDDGGINRGAVWVLFMEADGTVKAEQKISSTAGGFLGALDNGDEFGTSAASLGDLDLDGVADLAVGAWGDDDGGGNRGAVWILFLNADGTVKAEQEISDTAGGFLGTLDNSDEFGRSAGALGDLDLDGVVDLAVGAPLDDDGGSDKGAVWVLFLNTDGTVKAEQKISETAGGFLGTLDGGDRFGSSAAYLGDLDADGVADLAVGAVGDDDGGSGFLANRGAVWVLFLNPDGTVEAEQKISDTAGGFLGMLDNADSFGGSITSAGDLDGDGTFDLAVGAHGDDDGGINRGAVWVLFLEADGTVKAEQKISDTAGGFEGTLDDGDAFGSATAPLGDLDGDGVADVAVGAFGDDGDGTGGRTNLGAVWVLFLNADGTFKSTQKISDDTGGLSGTLDNEDRFGSAAASLGDLDGDDVVDLAVGALWDDDGGSGGISNRGAAWILFLNPDGTVKAEQKISDTAGGFLGTLDDEDEFGTSVASLGDLDGDGNAELAVGAPRDDDGGVLSIRDLGAVWVLFLKANGTVKSHLKISATAGGFLGTLQHDDRFGSSVVSLGDLDRDGIVDLAVGAPRDDDGGSFHGAVWVLFFNANGTVKSHQKISDTAGGFTGTTNQFGSSLALLGDIDRDGIAELAVGAPVDPGGSGLFGSRGAVWVLFLNQDGTVRSHQKIGATAGGFLGTLDELDVFGSSAALLGDLDGDGTLDLAVGAPGDDDGGISHGAVWVLSLKNRLRLTR